MRWVIIDFHVISADDCYRLSNVPLGALPHGIALVVLSAQAFLPATVLESKVVLIAAL